MRLGRSAARRIGLGAAAVGVGLLVAGCSTERRSPGFENPLGMFSGFDSVARSYVAGIDDYVEQTRELNSR